MTTFSIGIDVTRAALRVGRVRQQLRPTVDGAMEEWAEDSRKALKSTPYPPARDTDYVRTGQLANRWKKWRVSMTGMKIIWALGNAAVGKYGQLYTSYVVGDEEGRQAWMHAGIWWQAVKVLEARIPALKAKVHLAIIKAWNL